MRPVYKEDKFQKAAWFGSLTLPVARLWWSEMKWMCWWWRDAERSRKRTCVVVFVFWCDTHEKLYTQVKRRRRTRVDEQTTRNIKAANKIPFSCRMYSMYEIYFFVVHIPESGVHREWAQWAALCSSERIGEVVVIRMKISLGRVSEKKAHHQSLHQHWMNFWTELWRCFLFVCDCVIFFLFLLALAFFRLSTTCVGVFFFFLVPIRFVRPYFVCIFHCFCILPYAEVFSHFPNATSGNFGRCFVDDFHFHCFQCCWKQIRYRPPSDNLNTCTEMVTNDQPVQSF